MSLYAKKMRVRQCARKVSTVLVERHRVRVRSGHFVTCDPFFCLALSLIRPDPHARGEVSCGFVAYEWPGIVLPPP